MPRAAPHARIIIHDTSQDSLLDLPKRKPSRATAKYVHVRRQDANALTSPRTSPPGRVPDVGTGTTVAIGQLRHHKCDRKHRTSQTLLACMFPRLGRVYGHGRFVLLAYCGTLTAGRYATPEEALAAPNMTGAPCGSHCYGRHKVVELIDPAMAFPWPT
jgi:hypothetical protein